MSNSSVWSINRTLSGATTPVKSGSGSDGNEEVLQIPQRSTAGTKKSDGLQYAYLERSYPSAELQSEHSTASADWVAEVSRNRRESNSVTLV